MPRSIFLQNVNSPFDILVNRADNMIVRKGEINMDVTEIITKSMEEFDAKTALNDLIQWLSTDALVTWFVENYWVEELEEFDKERAQAIRDYYDQHC